MKQRQHNIQHNIQFMGIDLAKHIFAVHGIDAQGNTMLRKKVKRRDVVPLIAHLPPCVIGMEACGGAHAWARSFERFGHTVRLISPQCVKPYVHGNKNDLADAQAICEALTRPHMRFVPIKQPEHQDIQCVHRARERVVRQRTALCHELRGLLVEYGIVLPQGVTTVEREVPKILEDAEHGLSLLVRRVFAQLLEELKYSQQHVQFYDQMIAELMRIHEPCQRLIAIEGIGPISATALLAALPNAKLFRHGREFAAWLGLVPRHVASGGKTTMLGISKRGDRYLRSLLIHGARAVARQATHKTDRRSQWVVQKIATRGWNKACVALANKNARIAWAILARGSEYQPAG